MDDFQSTFLQKLFPRYFLPPSQVARTLVAFEYMWYEAWCKAVEAARDGLTATLIIKHPKSGRLYVNFDAEILQLIRRD